MGAVRMCFLSNGGVLTAVLSSFALAAGTSLLHHDGTPLRRLVRSESGAWSEKRLGRMHVQGVLNAGGAVAQRDPDGEKKDGEKKDVEKKYGEKKDAEKKDGEKKDEQKDGEKKDGEKKDDKKDGEKKDDKEDGEKKDDKKDGEKKDDKKDEKVEEGEERKGNGNGADDDENRVRAGVCVGIHGIHTKKASNVKVLADLSDCGAGVKELVADLSNNTSPLATCAQKVENDADCGHVFQMEHGKNAPDGSHRIVCSCLKGAGACPKRTSKTTCAYTLVPPVCSNATGIELHSQDSLFKVKVVYPTQFGVGCTNAKNLGANFSGGLQACADAVANNPECGTTFQMHRQTSNCTCLKPKATCDYQDSTEICQYQVVPQIMPGNAAHASGT